MLAAITMVQPRFPVPPDVAPRVQQYALEMKRRIQPQLLEQLAMVVSRFPKDLSELVPRRQALRATCCYSSRSCISTVASRPAWAATHGREAPR